MDWPQETAPTNSMERGVPSHMDEACHGKEGDIRRSSPLRPRKKYIQIYYGGNYRWEGPFSNEEGVQIKRGRANVS